MLLQHSACICATGALICASLLYANDALWVHYRTCPSDTYTDDLQCAGPCSVRLSAERRSMRLWTAWTWYAIAACVVYLDERPHGGAFWLLAFGLHMCVFAAVGDWVPEMFFIVEPMLATTIGLSWRSQ